MSASAGDRSHPWRSLISIGPHAGAHHVALRTGLSVGAPLLALWATGRLDWALYAAFGAFTAIYGRSLAGRARLRMQASAAVTFVASVVLGTAIALVPGSPWVLVGAAAVWAAIIALVSERFAWAPPGAIFQVFALGACASAPANTAALLPAVLVSAGVAALALLIGLVPGGPVREAVAPMRLPALLRRREVRVHLLRYLLAAGIAGAIATAVGLGHPYWAALSAVVPLAAADTAGRLLRAGQRLLGTLVGLGIAAAVLAFHPSGLVAVLIAVVLQVCAELFVVRNYGLALVFITPLALVMVGIAHPVDPTVLIVDRAIDTLLGVAVGMALTLATHERRVQISGDDPR